MGVPKKKRSHMKTRLRRTHQALGKINLGKCSKCGEPTLPHRVCPNCHTYKGKRVIEVED